MPGLVAPADIPHDAEGRVAFVTVTVPEAVPSDGEPGAGSTPGSAAAEAAPGRAGWMAVAVLTAVLIVTFVVGMVATR